jgi:predicted ester cyclase
MAVVTILGWPDTDISEYDAVIEALGYSGGQGEPGGIYRAAVSEGGVEVIDVWKSQEYMQALVNNRLMPVLQRLEIAPPSRQEVYPIHTLVIPPGRVRNAPGGIRYLFDLPGVTAEQYDQVFSQLESSGLKHPKGRLLHVAAPSPTGWFVMDVWDSPESAQAFMPSLVRLMAQAGIPTDAPPRPTSLHNTLVQPDEERNKDVVTRHFLELWPGDYSVADEIYSTACVGHVLGTTVTGYPKREVDGIKEQRAGMSNMEVEIEDQFADGDRVLTRWTTSGTNTGPIFGNPPTGRDVSVTGMHVHRLEDGRIVEVWSQADLFSLMQQLGMLPTLEPSAV